MKHCCQFLLYSLYNLKIKFRLSMSNAKRVSILEHVLLAVILTGICRNKVSAASDLLISEKLNAELDPLKRTLHVKYLPGLILEVEGIIGFRVYFLGYPGGFENYLELRFLKNTPQDKQTRGNQNDEIYSTLWNCTQLNNCFEVSRSSGITLTNSSNRVRLWFTFHGSFKAGLGVDLKSFQFLQFNPPSFLDFISYVNFSSSGSQLRIYRTPFINKCLLMANESRDAIYCGNELTDEAVCVSCGCCYNPDILPSVRCFKPIGSLDLVDYKKCSVPISKVTESIQFHNNGPICVGFNATFVLAFYKRSYNIQNLLFDVDFGDGFSVENQRLLPSSDSDGLRTRRGYTWRFNHSYSESALYEISVKKSNGVTLSHVLMVKTDLAVDRHLLQPEDYHVIHDLPAVVGDGVNVLLLIQLYSQPLRMQASLNDSNAVEKVVISSSRGLPEWLDDALDAELKLLGPQYQGVLKSMTDNYSETNPKRKSTYQGLFRHVFTKAGDYSISFTITTVCGSMTVNRTLSVHEGSTFSFKDFVGSVDVVTNGSVAVQEDAGIVVFMQHFTKNTYVEIHLGDDSAVLTFLPKRHAQLPPWAIQQFGSRQDYSSVATSHRYTVGGKYRVQVIIEDVILNQHISKTVDVEVTCYANITFPGHSGSVMHPVNKPLMVRRDIIQNCTSVHPKEEWHIYQATSKSDHLPLPVNVEVKPGVGLVVPPYTLVPAVYTIEIKVLIALSKDSGPKTISDQLQVEFISAGILTSIRAPESHTLAFDSVLTLDASNSKDLDDPVHSGSGLSFTWFCSMSTDFSQADPVSTVKGSSCTEARPLKLSSTEAVLRYRTGHLFNKAEIREISFHVRVTKPGRRPGNATHSVRLLRSYVAPLGLEEDQPSENRGMEASDNNFIPYVVIVCVQNCNKSINPDYQLELGVLCVNCYMSDVLSYQWSFTIHGSAAADDASRPKIDLEAAAKYGTDKSDIVVEAGTFEDIGSQQKCTISVQVTFPTKKDVTVGYDFSVQPPDDAS